MGVTVLTVVAACSSMPRRERKERRGPEDCHIQVSCFLYLVSCILTTLMSAQCLEAVVGPAVALTISGAILEEYKKLIL